MIVKPRTMPTKPRVCSLSPVRSMRNAQRTPSGKRNLLVAKKDRFFVKVNHVSVVHVGDLSKWIMVTNRPTHLFNAAQLRYLGLGFLFECGQQLLLVRVVL